MSRDIHTLQQRCHYCDRPGVIQWDADLLSCRHEVCASLAFAERRHRHPSGGAPEPRRTRVHHVLSGAAR
jgi:hypothetical protein